LNVKNNELKKQINEVIQK